MRPPRDAHCCLCGALRRPTQAPVESFGNGHEVLSMREHRDIREGAPLEISPQMIVAVSMWRNGGGLKGEHICDGCVIVGLRAAKRFVDSTLIALGAVEVA